MVQTETMYDALLLDKLIALQSLELKDIRGFTDLRLEFAPPPPNSGQWVVILGQNGVGKTTLLRSVALALRNLDDRPIWPDAFSGWPRTMDASGKLARHAWIKTTLTDGSVHQTDIVSNGSTKFTQTPEQNDPSQCLLFAYGCRRGSTTGGPKREYSFDKEGGPEIATLFEEFAGMVHAETWLKDLSSKPALLRAVLDAIKTFLDVASVMLQDGNLLVAEHNKPPLALKQLSDGYLTSAGWFIDLLARWIDYAGRQGRTIEPGFMQHMRGLVLIDEIDLHLHPRWQIEIIRRTRTLMPQMSFIVTTHNPLTLVGAKAEEIWILENQEGNINATRGIEAPLLLTGGQIYTRYFGIRDIYPDGLGSDMQRYNFLSRYALRNDAEQLELDELKTRLAQAGILPEWPIVARELPDSTAPARAKPRRRAEGKK
jgi:energy-coupling factor transporter ATP-binding protein EcfA2